MVSTGGVRKHEVVQGSLETCPGGVMACPGGLQVKHTLVHGRCNQIDACPGCTLACPRGGGGGGGVSKTDTCPGVILHIVPRG